MFWHFFYFIFLIRLGIHSLMKVLYLLCLSFLYLYIQWWPKLLEHLTDLKILTLLPPKYDLTFHNVHKTWSWLLWAQQISDKVIHTVFLFTFKCNIWYVLLVSGTVSVHFLRTSKRMLSHAFCNYSLRLSFEYTTDLSILFSDGVDVQPVHHFQWSGWFLPTQVVLGIVVLWLL